MGGSPFESGCCGGLRTEVDVTAEDPASELEDSMPLGDDRRAERSLLLGGALGDPESSSGKKLNFNLDIYMDGRLSNEPFDRVLLRESESERRR